MQDNSQSLLYSIKAAVIHKKIGNEIREIIKPEMNLHDIAFMIEEKIQKETNFDIFNPLEKGIAFPIGLSLNNCAAHYTPNYNEKPIFLQNSDILKIDYGVHIKGNIIDSAFTMHFDTKYDEFIHISKNLTNYAVSQCGIDVILGELGEKIEEYIHSKEIEIDGKIYPLKIMNDLSGHSIKPYKIHAGKAVPNIKIHYPLRMQEFEYYAIEPFITTGLGDSILKEPVSHYMINSNVKYYQTNLSNSEKDCYDVILKNYYTLPFCQKWLSQIIQTHEINTLLKSLCKKNIINSYPPIYDIKNSIVSQFEHTIFIKENGIIHLTKNDFY
jgi:methionyl aminopeptidase